MKHGLIDRRDFEDWLIENCTRNMAQLVKGYIKEQPIVDAVPVVRCKDCIHWSNDSIGYCKYHEIYPSRHDLDDWFCADGVRKEQSE